jgi:RNA polymerase sigma-70 factor (ECF subfamily)
VLIQLPDTDTGEIVLRAVRGDSSAFEQLVTRLHLRVFRWALAFASDPDEADDIVQETFVLVYRRLSQFRADGSAAAWIYRITRHAGLERRRAFGRRARLAASPRALPERTAYTTDPGARVDRASAVALIRLYFEDLPPRQREIFDLVDLQGYDPAEAAKMTSLNPNTVRANLFKARATIRARMIAGHPGLFVP